MTDIIGRLNLLRKQYYNARRMIDNDTLNADDKTREKAQIHIDAYTKNLKLIKDAKAEITRLRNPWVPIENGLPPECLDGKYVIFGLIVDAGNGSEWELATGRMCQSGNAAGTWQYVQGSMNGNTTDAITSWFTHYSIPHPPKGPTNDQ